MTSDITNNDEFELVRDAGKQIVAKRNDFIQESRFSMSLIENKILLYMFSKVKPTDTPDMLYEFQFAEMFAVLRYKTDSYTEVRRLIQSINGLSFWRDAIDADDDDELITFFQSDTVVANQKKGYFKLKFSRKLFPYILQLQQQKEKDGIYYTSYQLQNVILMKHYYSQRLYEILKSYQFNNKKWRFELGTGTVHDLQRRIAGVNSETREAVIPEGWKNWYIFNRDVLKPAEKDINQYTDIKIKYEPSKIDFEGKKHRGYVTITFAMVGKTKVELAERDKFIDEAYRDLHSEMNDTKYKQSTLDQFLMEQGKKELAEEFVNEKPQASNHPEFLETFSKHFPLEQVEILYAESISHIVIGMVNAIDREQWSIDYCNHYFVIIQATVDETKSTVFRRLLNDLKNDYDNYANKLSKEYSVAKIPIKEQIKIYTDKMSKIMENG